MITGVSGAGVTAGSAQDAAMASAPRRHDAAKSRFVLAALGPMTKVDHGECLRTSAPARFRSHGNAPSISGACGLPADEAREPWGACVEGIATKLPQDVDAGVPRAGELSREHREPRVFYGEKHGIVELRKAT